MKKLIYLLSISFVMMFFTSCFEKLDNWYSETAAYDGRFVVANTCEEDDAYNTTLRDGNEVLIYNSAANIANEIIIDTHVGFNLDTESPYPVKGKFKVEGSSLNFKAGQIAENLSKSAKINDDDMLVIFRGNYYLPSDLGDAEDLGEEYDAVQLYTRFSVEEGKITPKGATTIGGNVSDEVSLKMTMYFDFFVIESYEIPKADWANPNVPEYGWREKAGSRHNADGWEEHWNLEGYRYTGYPEDDPNWKPPVIEK